MEGLEKYSFGRKLLESQGWTSGKGLGKEESGISEALKPTLKFDKAGVGHNQGDDFSFHWWDHVYKKAANNIVVEHSEDGVAMRQKEAQTDLISTKKWKHKKKKKKSSTSTEHKPLTYGVFKKSATLTQDGEVMESQAAAAVVQSSDDEDYLFHHADQDNEAFKECEGRTAHKGARHGLTASGKLMRLEAQEMGLLDTVATNGTKSSETPSKSNKRKNTEAAQECIENDLENGTPVRIKRKKKKKRKAALDDVDIGNDDENPPGGNAGPNVVTEVIADTSENGLGNGIPVKNGLAIEQGESPMAIKKKRKKRKHRQESIPCLP